MISLPFSSPDNTQVKDLRDCHVKGKNFALFKVFTIDGSVVIKRLSAANHGRLKLIFPAIFLPPEQNRPDTPQCQGQRYLHYSPDIFHQHRKMALR